MVLEAELTLSLKHFEPHAEQAFFTTDHILILHCLVDQAKAQNEIRLCMYIFVSATSLILTKGMAPRLNALTILSNLIKMAHMHLIFSLHGFFYEYFSGLYYPQNKFETCFRA